MIDFKTFPTNDAEWSEEQWLSLIRYFKETGLISYKDMASQVLSALNPPQVGTAIASKDTFKAQYPPRKTMQAVMKWFYDRPGYCVDCGSRLELQADHIKPKESYTNPADADFLDNLELRCRRCNVVKRESHKNGGKTFLTAAAALMWILFTKRPRTKRAYYKMCRDYGLTMASVRFDEAWAIAHWLHKEGKYELDDE